jgi:hypothetical protein
MVNGMAKARSPLTRETSGLVTGRISSSMARASTNLGIVNFVIKAGSKMGNIMALARVNLRILSMKENGAVAYAVDRVSVWIRMGISTAGIIRMGSETDLVGLLPPEMGSGTMVGSKMGNFMGRDSRMMEMGFCIEGTGGSAPRMGRE